MSTRRNTILAFHGFTLNGERMRAQLGGLFDALSTHADIVCPDAPHVCAEDSVARLYELWQVPRPAPPHLCWWDTTDDGSVYRGWPETLELVRGLLGKEVPSTLLGFSQGAILAAAVAALSAKGELPPLRSVVLLSGRTPRSDVLKPYFTGPIPLPSLHVWGNRDELVVSHGLELVKHFERRSTEICVWRGGHAIPTRGPAAATIVDFVRHHA